MEDIQLNNIMKKISDAYEETSNNINDLHNIITNSHKKLLDTLNDDDPDKCMECIKQLDDKAIVKSVVHGKADEHIKQINHIFDKLQLKSITNPDGTITGTQKYEKLDLGWAESIVELLEHNIFNFADFKKNDVIVNIENDVLICLFSDFGTGDWKDNNVASTISNSIKAQKPSYSIHLGDVYYSGTKKESRDKLLGFWPNGAKSSFTLNSNHEMYSGAIGYYDTSLASEIFKQQQQTSYFALENDYWVIVALDSAYFSDMINLYMDGVIDDTQIAFLEKIAKKDKDIVVLSHHNPIDITGTKTNKLWDQVYDVLGNKMKYWFYGHEHLGAVYKDFKNVKLRLIGHASLPYGNSSILANSDNVLWYEHTRPIANISPNNDRVQNGFCMVHFNDNNIKEDFYGEDGKVHYSIQ